MARRDGPIRRCAIVCVLALGAGCGGGDTGDSVAGAGERTGATSHRVPTVVSAFHPIHEIVLRLGGEDVEASNLTPPGSEPHHLEFTSDDIERLEGADVVFYLGNGFMPGLERALRWAGGEVVDLLEGLPLRESPHDHGHGEAEEGDGETEVAGADEHESESDEGDGDDAGKALDPHVWLDPQLMLRLTVQVEETLGTVHPAGEARYAARAEAYRAELRALDGEFAATLVDCQRNVFVTSHAAFGYLAHRYHLQEEAVTGLIPETEAEPGRIAEVAELVTDLGVTTVFAETLLPAKLVEAVARETGARVGVLNPLEMLTREELSDGADYLSVMRANLVALDEALDCVGTDDGALGAG